MGELSARKLSVISVDPDARSKKLDETLEKLSAIRKEQEGAQKAPMPSISAKRVDASDVGVEKTETIEQVNTEVAPARASVGLKGLRVTSGSSEQKKLEPEAKIEQKKAPVVAPKTVETQNQPPAADIEIPKKRVLLEEMFEGAVEQVLYDRMTSEEAMKDLQSKVKGI